MYLHVQNQVYKPRIKFLVNKYPVLHSVNGSSARREAKPTITKLPPGYAIGVKPPSATHRPNRAAMSAMVRRARRAESLAVGIHHGIDLDSKYARDRRADLYAHIKKTLNDSIVQGDGRNKTRTPLWMLTGAHNAVSDRAIAESKEREDRAVVEKPHEFLLPEVEYALARRFRDGDQAAGDKIIVAHQPQFRNAAKPFCERYADAEKDDVVQHLNLAATKALKTFDPDNERGARFATYVQLPIRWALSQLAKDYKRYNALNKTVGHDDLVEWSAAIPDSSPGADIERIDALAAALETLTPRELSIVEARQLNTTDSYKADPLLADTSGPTPERLAKLNEPFLYHSAKYSRRKPTLKALGKKHGISGERARQIGDGGLEKVRAHVRSKLGGAA